ncbi:MAG: hypothetical protein IJN29_00395 [Akkermansia sp.]|nr:hypothetical protein [Akkermansia sp.]
MKLHLPKLLLTAVLAVCVAPTSWATNREIWVNFGDVNVNSSTVPADSGLPAGQYWNNITGAINTNISGTYTTISKDKASSAVLNLKTDGNVWGPANSGANVLQQMQASYLDLSGDKTWSINFLVDDIAADNLSVSLYFSGDSDGVKYAPVSFNGTNYIGGTNQQGDAAWGERKNPVQNNVQSDIPISDLNTINVTGVNNGVTMSALSDNSVEGDTKARATLAGMSVSYDISNVYTTNLSSGTQTADSLTYTNGDSSVGWTDITTDDSYISLNGAADNSSEYAVAEGSSIKGIQANSNTVALTSDGAISVNKLWAKSGSTLNVDATLTASSDVTIGGLGNVVMNTSQTLGGLTLTGNLTIAKDVNVSLSGVSSISNGSTLSLLEGSLSNSGTLAINGHIIPVNIYSDNNAHDGYLQAGTYCLVENTGSGTISLGETAKLNNGLLELNNTSEGLYTTISDAKAEENAGKYYVNTVINYGGENTNNVIIADTTTGIVMNGGTLNLNKDLAESVNISTNMAGTINIGDGVTLNNSDVTAGTTKSTIAGGSGAVYNMGSGLQGIVNGAVNGGNTANVMFGENWLGTTVFTNSTIPKNNYNLFGYFDDEKASTLKFVGVNGWINNDGNGNKIQLNVVLENYVDADNSANNRSAFIFNDSSQANYEFTRKVSGDGDFQIATKSTYTFTIIFSGDTSEWTGGIKVTPAYDGSANTPNTTIALTGGGDIFNAETNGGITVNRGGTSNIKIGNAAKSSTMNGAIDMQNNSATLNLTVIGDTTFKKDVEVSSLTVDSSKTATIEAAATTGTLTTNGTVKVTGTGSLTYGGTTKVEALAAQTLATETTGATITANAITGGKVTFSGDNPVTEARTISGSDITNNAAAQATITLGAQNISLYAANGNIAATATQGAEIGTVNIGAGKTVGAHSTWSVDIGAISNKATLTVAETATFGKNATLNANLTLNNGAVLTLGEGGLNMNKSVLSLGSSLTLDEATVRRIMNLAEGSVVALFTNVESLILGGETYTAGTLTADDGVALGTVFNLSAEPMPTELTAAANTSYYLGFDGNGMVYAAQIVPEPTTATLSLLALAALAARRRRATR